MNARTEAEVDAMRSEFTTRVPESAILRFLDDYDIVTVDGIRFETEVVEHLLALNKEWKTNSIETIIRCINAVAEEVFKV